MIPNALNQITVCVMISFDTQIEVAVVIKKTEIYNILLSRFGKGMTQNINTFKSKTLIVYNPILNS